MPRRAIAVLLTAAIAAACGSPSPSGPSPAATTGDAGSPTLAPPPIDLSDVPARVHVEPNAATSAWVGPAGGTLTATAADGTAYRLDVPADALLANTPIAMTPVQSIDELGLSGGLAGAVHLQPSGLQLTVPATLTITTTRTAPGSTRLFGLHVGDDGTTTDLIPSFEGDGAITVVVHHFSDPGAGWGTGQDVTALSASPTGRMAGLISQLLSFDVLWDDADKGIAKGLLIAGWGVLMEPELDDVASDQDLLRAIADWRQFVFLLNLFDRNGDESLAVRDGDTYRLGFSADLKIPYQAGLDKIARLLMLAIDTNKIRCKDAHDLVALANGYFWARMGLRYNPTFTSWLDQPAGCAEIDLPVANLPTNLVAGGSDSLNLQFRFLFDDGTTASGEFEATLSGARFTFQGGQPTIVRRQPDQASLTAFVDATDAPPYTLTASACWIRDGINQGLCSRPFMFPFGTGPVTAEPVTPPPATGAVGSIAGDYTIVVTCNFLQYGVGSGQITQSGNQVEMSWTASLNPDRDLATRDSLCWTPFARGQFPTSGSWSGTMATVPGGTVITFTAVANGPCNEPARPAPATMNVGFFMALPINGCVGPGTPVQYRASLLRR